MWQSVQNLGVNSYTIDCFRVMPFGITNYTWSTSFLDESTSTSILAYDTRSIFVVRESMAMGLPILEPILPSVLGCQHSRGSDGRVAQIGVRLILSSLNSKQSGMCFKSRGRPYTKQGPSVKIYCLSSSRAKRKINQPLLCCWKLDPQDWDRARIAFNPGNLPAM